MPTLRRLVAIALICGSLPLAYLLAQGSSMPDTVLIQNMENIEALPKRFRTTSDPLKKGLVAPLPSTEGLAELRASASGQFSQKSLETILKKLNNPPSFYVVDLRQEYHGFMNGIAVSWYAYRDWGNKGKSLQQIEEGQEKLLQAALKERNVTIYKIVSKTGTGYIQSKQPINIVVEHVATEEQLTKSMGLHYLRIPVTDHLKPTPEEVDRFIVFVRGLPKDAWVHFHCAGGAGRSTSFLSMYDMMRNAKKVSLSDIFARQWLIGGYHFERKPVPASWKNEYALDRLSFMKKFYEYCRSNQDDYKELWSDYLRRHEEGEQ